MTLTPDERLAVEHFDCPMCGVEAGENCLVVTIDENSLCDTLIVRPHSERIALLSAVDRLAERGRG